MKYLKLFEYQNEFGIDLEYLKYFFTDFTDSGWLIKISDENSLFHEFRKIKINFFNLPYIKIILCKKEYSSSKIRLFMDSEEFKDQIEVISNRLKDFDLYVREKIVTNSQLIITIYKNSDLGLLKNSKQKT